MDTKILRQKILDLAIRGKLVPQDPDDEPASVLLEKIRAEKQQMVEEGKLKAKDVRNDTIIFKGEDNLYYEQFSDGNVKCIENEIPFEVPDGWEWSKINMIAFVTKLAGFEYTKNIAPNLCETGIPLFKGKNIQNGNIIYEFESYIPDEISTKLVRSQINRKCILTPYVGTIGNIGIHNRTGKYHLGSNVGKIELYNANAILMEEYVVSYLQSSYGNQQLTKYMKATAQASISIEAIRDVYIPIPPGNEEKKICKMISNVLSVLDSIIDNKYEINILIETVKSKILDLAIHGKLVPQNPDDEPASVLLENIRAEKENLVKQGKIRQDKKESVIFKSDDNFYFEKIGNNICNITENIPFEIPDNWSWCRLKNIAANEEYSFVDGPFGSDLKTIHYTDKEEVRIVQLNNIGEDGWKDTGKKYTTFEHAQNIERCISVPGDIIIAKMMPAGRTIILPDINNIYVISSDCIRLRADSRISKEYLSLMLNSPSINKLILDTVQGIGRTRTSLNKIKDLPIPVPPVMEQLQIVKTVYTYFRYLICILEAL